MKNRPVVFPPLFAVLCVLLLVSFSACGRRGDPIPLSPHEGEVIQENTDRKRVPPVKVEAPAVKIPAPVAPSGLSAVYTGGTVIVAWDEIRGQGVEYYKVYRSTGKDYVHVGNTLMPVFIDKDVALNKKYYYKVAAVGTDEGPLSEKVGIKAEVR